MNRFSSGSSRLGVRFKPRLKLMYSADDPTPTVRDWQKNGYRRLDAAI